jgi:hypothetical protein
MKPTYEKELEKKLGEEVKALGCKYLKIQIRSYPDRLILTKCGTAIWVETKQLGKKPRTASASRFLSVKTRPWSSTS